MKSYFVQEVCCLDRAIEIVKSIKDVWIIPYKDIINDEKGVSFGLENGYVIYNYVTDNEYEIDKILREVR